MPVCATDRYDTQRDPRRTPCPGAVGGEKNIVSYIVTVKICGTSPMLLHAWKPDAIFEKTCTRARKQTLEEEMESRVYRTEGGNIGIPGEYLRHSVIGAARFRRDPRSPRKSAEVLFKSIVSLTELADTGKATWDRLDVRKITIMRTNLTRRRPMLDAGWEATFLFLVDNEEQIPPDAFRETLSLAGRMIGIGDFRPAFGRFEVVSFEVEEAA